MKLSWSSGLIRCLLSTERLVHTTVPWRGHGERRSIFLKFVPYGLHYTDRRYDNTRAGLNTLQREILSYPEVFLNEARNRASPYFDEGKELGEWTPLPVHARM